MPLSPIILYHANCDDSFGAAYSAWMHFGDNAEYRPVQYGDPVSVEPLIGRQVYILDFSFSPDTILAMSQVATQITLLDHHKSAAEQWQGIVPSTNTVSIRIATWNIDRPKQNGTTRNQKILEQVRKVNADIWILTETNASIIPESREPDPFSGFVGLASRPESPSKPGQNKTTIWSRYGIKRSIETYDPDTIVCAEIDTPIGLMLVYGTIITYWNDTDKDYPEQWKKHQAEIDEHRKDWQKIFKKFPDHILCIAGDFNQNWDGTRWFPKVKMNDDSVGQLLAHLTDHSLACVTRKDIRKEMGFHRASVDHICLSERIANRNIKDDYWYVDGFTHNGVCVDIPI